MESNSEKFQDEKGAKNSEPGQEVPEVVHRKNKHLNFTPKN